MKLFRALLFLPLSALGNPGSNETEIINHLISGNQLYEDFKSYKGQAEESQFNRAYYLGYVTGAVDMGNHALFCLPNGVTAGQIADSVGKYLTDNPQRRHFSGARLVAEALAEHYPCKGAQ